VFTVVRIARIIYGYRPTFRRNLPPPSVSNRKEDSCSEHCTCYRLDMTNVWFSIFFSETRPNYGFSTRTSKQMSHYSVRPTVKDVAISGLSTRLQLASLLYEVIRNWRRRRRRRRRRRSILCIVMSTGQNSFRNKALFIFLPPPSVMKSGLTSNSLFSCCPSLHPLIDRSIVSVSLGYLMSPSC
jgi:hypothetical protein